MDNLLEFGEDALLNRKSKSACSFESRLFRFLVSDNFECICSAMFHTKATQTIKTDWPILVLGNVLGEIYSKWLIDAVRNEIRKKYQKLFQKSLYFNLSGEELKSETNRVMGWAIVLVRGNQKDETSLYKNICEMKIMVDESKDANCSLHDMQKAIENALKNTMGDQGICCHG